jgi:hypothetical protein
MQVIKIKVVGKFLWLGFKMAVAIIAVYLASETAVVYAGF